MATKGSTEGRIVARIIVDGEYIDVNARDQALWMLVQTGDITRAQMYNYRKSLPVETKFATTMQEVRVDVAAGPSATTAEKAAARGAYIGAGGEEGGTAAVETTLASARRDAAGTKVRDEGVMLSELTGEIDGTAYVTEAARATHTLKDKGLITEKEMLELSLTVNPDWSAEEVYGLAMGIFEISDDDMVAKLPEITSTGQLQPALLTNQQWRERLQRQTVGRLDTAVGNVVGAIGGAVGQARRSDEAEELTRQKLLTVLDELEGRTDISETQVKRIRNKLAWGKELSLEDAKAVAIEIKDLEIDLSEESEIVIGNVSEGEAVDTEPRGEDDYLYDAPLGDGSYEFAEEQRMMAMAPPPIQDMQQLNTLQDFAEYIGFVGPEDQVPLNVVVDTGITGPGGDQEALIHGDMPAYMFYDKATGRYWNAAQQERYLQGKLAYERGYAGATGPDLPGGVMDEYRDIVTTPYSEGTKERFQAIGGAQGAFLAMEHGAEYKPTIGSQFADPNLPWERQAYNWQPGGARAWADSMTGKERRQMEREYKKAGFYDVYDDAGRKYFTNPNDDSVFVGVSNEILRISRGRDIDPLQAIGVLKDERQRVNNEQQAFLAAEQARAKIVSAPTKLPFSIPRELRYIPDYKTIAEDVKSRFFVEMGREPLPGELEEMAGQLTGYHEQAQQAKIRMAYASWEGNDTEIMDPGELERIGDPGSQTTFDIKNRFASEINLNKRQETNADSFSRVINATRGAEVGTPVAVSTNVVGR